MGYYYEPNGAGPFYDAESGVIPTGDPVLVTQVYDETEYPVSFNITTPSAFQLLYYQSSGVWFNGPPAFGNQTTGDYTAFENDGTMVAYQAARCYRDELGPLIGYKLESPSSHITYNLAEGSLTFDDACTLSDYVVIPYQLNHDRVSASAINPHMHWWKTSSNIPNWLIQYRWQVNGAAKETVWVPIARVAEIFAYSSGTLNQISTFGSISPPASEGVSSIVQIKLCRDTNNDSGLFAGTDPLVGDADVLQLDVHVLIDMLGSRTEFVK